MPATPTPDYAADLAGIDSLDVPVKPARPWRLRAWEAGWPKVAAVVLFFALWELVALTKWKPAYVLPGPLPVLRTLWREIANGHVPSAVAVTMRRALVGFGLALAIGLAAGAVVARSRALRAAVGSMITGLQTMPTIAWFPLAILLFGITETAITFVVVLGAAPSIANGVISGADHIPRTTLRAGRMLGARGLSFYRHVLIPGAIPGIVAGLKQGWAFAWRSLMAGELIVIVAHRRSLGVELQNARDFSDAEGMLATMIVIFVIGIVVDGLVFGRIDRAVRRRRGLLGA
jgi:NitT/TauT family transport system permease protein